MVIEVCLSKLIPMTSILVIRTINTTEYQKLLIFCHVNRGAISTIVLQDFMFPLVDYHNYHDYHDKSEKSVEVVAFTVIIPQWKPGLNGTSSACDRNQVKGYFTFLLTKKITKNEDLSTKSRKMGDIMWSTDSNIEQ